MRRVGVLVAIVALGGCGGGGGQAPGSSGVTPTVTALSISGPTVLHAIGETESLTATATLSNGSTRDETATATWRSSDVTVVTVDIVGRVRAIAAGSAQITASSGTAVAQVTVRVAPPNWTQLAPLPSLNAGGPADVGAEVIAVDPRDDNILYVGSQLGLYVSRNGGASWARTETGFVHALAIDPRNPDRLYATINAKTLVRTTDAGRTFATLGALDDDILVSLLISSLEDRTIYVGYGGYGDANPSGTWKSADDGAHWTRQPFGVNGALIPWVVAQDAITGTLYAGTEIADHPQPYHPPLFTSPDRGKTWLDATNGLSWHVIAMHVNPDDHSVLALTEGDALYKSTDAARSWQLVSRVHGISLTVDPRDATRMFAGDVVFGSSTGGAFASYDGGKTFFASGLSNMTVGELAFNGTSTRLFAACYGSGVYVTDLDPPGR